MTKNPPKHHIVLARWENRACQAKWTGKRWLRFNEVFGGFDQAEPPSEWVFLIAENVVRMRAAIYAADENKSKI